MAIFKYYKETQSKEPNSIPLSFPPSRKSPFPKSPSPGQYTATITDKHGTRVEKVPIRPQRKIYNRERSVRPSRLSLRHASAIEKEQEIAEIQNKWEEDDII